MPVPSRSEQRRSFSQPVRVRLLERDADVHEDTLDNLEKVMHTLTTNVAVLGRTIAIYATVGSIVGGAVVGGIVAALT